MIGSTSGRDTILLRGVDETTIGFATFNQKAKNISIRASADFGAVPIPTSIVFSIASWKTVPTAASMTLEGENVSLQAARVVGASTATIIEITLNRPHGFPVGQSLNCELVDTPPHQVPSYPILPGQQQTTTAPLPSIAAAVNPLTLLGSRAAAHQANGNDDVAAVGAYSPQQQQPGWPSSRREFPSSTPEQQGTMTDPSKGTSSIEYPPLPPNLLFDTGSEKGIRYGRGRRYRGGGGGLVPWESLDDDAPDHDGSGSKDDELQALRAGGSGDAPSGGGGGASPSSARYFGEKIVERLREQEAIIDLCPVFVSWFLYSVWVIANYFVCWAISLRGGPWTNALWWTLLANTVLASTVPYFASAKMASIRGDVDTLHHRRTQPMLLGAITSIVWIAITGSCVAAAHRSYLDGAALMQPSATVNVHCFQRSGKKVNVADDSVHFVLLDEPQWEVGWRDWNEQRVKVIRASDGDAASAFFSYCVAPIKYRGAVNCVDVLGAVSFFAVCDISGSGGGSAASPITCGAAEAERCGWNVPANGVVMRRLKPGGKGGSDLTFLEGFSDDDIAEWKSASDLYGGAASMSTTGNLSASALITSSSSIGTNVTSPSSQGGGGTSVLLVAYNAQSPDATMAAEVENRLQLFTIATYGMTVGYPMLLGIVYIILVCKVW